MYIYAVMMGKGLVQVAFKPSTSNFLRHPNKQRKPNHVAIQLMNYSSM